MNPNPSSLIDDIRALLIPTMTEVFATMFGSEVKAAATQVPAEPGHALLASSVGFIGDINGVVYIRLADSLARKLASRMLGLPVEALEDEMVNDVVGELSNIVVGSVKSHLCDQGTNCILTIPSVVRGQDLRIEPLQSTACRIIGFRTDDEYLQLELQIKNRQ
jgi:chemotaxis protein CheX